MLYIAEKIATQADGLNVHGFGAIRESTNTSTTLEYRTQQSSSKMVQELNTPFKFHPPFIGVDNSAHPTL